MKIIAIPINENRTDAQRRAKNKYESKTMSVLGCKMKKADAEIFKAACKDSGTTVNAVFTRAAAEFIAEYSAGKKMNGG